MSAPEGLFQACEQCVTRRLFRVPRRLLVADENGRGIVGVKQRATGSAEDELLQPGAAIEPHDDQIAV